MTADRFVRGAALALLVATTALGAGCGGSGSGQTSSGNAFLFLTVDLFSVSGSTPVSNVNSNLGDRQATTSVCVTLRNTSKNPTITTPTALDNVVINQYTVSISRFDGGPTPGPFTFNTAFLVPAGAVANGALSGNTARIPVVLVPAQAKSEPPLLPRPGTPLASVATVIFKGSDGRGQGVETQGSVSLTFTFDQDTAEPAAAC